MFTNYDGRLRFLPGHCFRLEGTATYYRVTLTQVALVGAVVPETIYEISADYTVGAIALCLKRHKLIGVAVVLKSQMI